MLTGVYCPNDLPILWNYSTYFYKGDYSSIMNVASFVEKPSYCVRLLVFDYGDCLND